MFDHPYSLESGPQRREPEQPEAWQRALDERCPDTTKREAA